ncbi:MAG: 1-acyl-sn-glycerol-3-phosphate acyltransferase [Tannerellaceae bacterium]|jgi:1-acyl-sn-glycerol-3-phosphate acyltransferase|nr:1-acyl-sn-glycerol-3-phosphate acyltransferase [Tannerellaceae bacterium]
MFEDIRPFYSEEVPRAIESLLGESAFFRALRFIKPEFDQETFIAALRACSTKEEFKHVLAYDAVTAIANATTFSLDITGGSRLAAVNPCTFISNHRDIILDAAFLNTMLFNVGRGMTQIAIGSNLLVWPWIETLVRLNNSFIVKRGLPLRQQLEASRTLSQYIHHTIKETHESVWIAQREGRCKDSNDQTQGSILKMLNMAGQESIIDNLLSLNIVPIALSYEIDPCDYLKAREYQQKRDNPAFEKDPRDDLFNMETGILSYKGRVHITIAHPINDVLAGFDKDMDKVELYTAIAGAIDKEIHLSYRFYANNYVAYDLITEGQRFSSLYSSREKTQFEEYLRQQIDKIVLPDKDEAFLRHKILEMYSNPLKNHLIALQSL